MAQLVVIVGPIGAGKSTVSRMLAERLQSVGLVAVVVDVDDVVRMAHAPEGRTDAVWAAGHRAHGALVRAWLATDAEVVIAHGPIFTPEETGVLMEGVPAGVPTLCVLLLVSYEVALARVTGDPERGLSKDPRFLRWTHERFAAVRPDMAAFDREYDTEEASANEIVDRLVPEVLARRSRD